MLSKLKDFFEFLWLWFKGFRPVEFVRGDDRISLHACGWRANGSGRMKSAKDAYALLDDSQPEQWRQIYCGLTPFLVSDKGDVRNVDGSRAKLLMSNGRYQVLYKPDETYSRKRSGGRQHKKRVYRYMLVAMAFLDFKKGDTEHEVHHVNGYRTDDRLVNLMVVTHEEHTRIHNMGPCALSGPLDEQVAASGALAECKKAPRRASEPADEDLPAAIAAMQEKRAAEAKAAEVEAELAGPMRGEHVPDEAGSTLAVAAKNREEALAVIAQAKAEAEEQANAEAADEAQGNAADEQANAAGAPSAPGTGTSRSARRRRNKRARRVTTANADAASQETAATAEATEAAAAAEAETAVASAANTAETDAAHETDTALASNERMSGAGDMADSASKAPDTAAEPASAAEAAAETDIAASANAAATAQASGAAAAEAAASDKASSSHRRRRSHSIKHDTTSEEATLPVETQPAAEGERERNAAPQAQSDASKTSAAAKAAAKPAQTSASKPAETDWAAQRAALIQAIEEYLADCHTLAEKTAAANAAQTPDAAATDKDYSRAARPVYKALNPMLSCPDDVTRFDTAIAALRLIADDAAETGADAPQCTCSLVGVLQKMLKDAVRKLMREGDDVVRACVEEMLNDELSRPSYKVLCGKGIRQSIAIAHSFTNPAPKQKTQADKQKAQPKQKQASKTKGQPKQKQADKQKQQPKAKAKAKPASATDKACTADAPTAA